MRLTPSSATGWRAAAIAGSCVVALLAVLTGELVIPAGASLGALTLVPVVAAAWLLQTRLATVVVAIALLVRIAGVLHGLDPVTAGAEVAMLLMAAASVRGASALLTRWRESEVARSLQAAEMAVMAARERIAAGLHSREVRTIFATTLKLQAALTMAGTDDMRERVEAAIADLDKLTAELRKDVFA